jgi:DNA polymerase III subunit gamma/tau
MPGTGGWSMEQLALYREWRPQRFADLVGQEHVSRTLLNAVRSGRVAHAYLFCGPRGTGKTSTARIFAKALNCTAGSDGEPCNNCDSCRSITSGIAMDVIEMDAASHRGIEEIRDLKQKVGFAPSSGRYKIYIIDEAHMLTGEAFNALLKTLEEPPRHTIFILATTEAHKVPPTILSRCQRFDFRRLGCGLIAQHLARIAAEKGWQVDEDALTLLSRQAGGALRDALGLLDQVASFAGGLITRADVEALTGSLNEEILQPVISSLLKGDVPAMLRSLDQLYALGCETRQILFQLIEYMRDRLFSAPAEEQAHYAKYMRGLAVADGEMRESGRPDLVLEMALLRLIVTSAPVDKAASAYNNAPSVSECHITDQNVHRQGSNLYTGQVASADVEPSVKATTAVQAPDIGSLQRFLIQHFEKNPLLKSLTATWRIDLFGKRVIIKVPPFDAQLLQKGENLHILQQAVRQYNGDWEVEIAVGDESAFGEEKRVVPAPALPVSPVTVQDGLDNDGPGAKLHDDQLVGVTLSLFKGKVINFKEEGD